jgi:hypothetical protein
MVLFTIPGLALLVSVLAIPAEIVAAQGSHPVDTLALRGFSLDDELDFATRGYDNEPLSVREYIDSQIELALREYQEEFEQLFARHTREEIDAKVRQFQRALARSQPLLGPAVARLTAARKALRAEPRNEVLKAAYERAKTEEASQRGIVEYNEEQLQYWSSQTPSPTS